MLRRIQITQFQALLEINPQKGSVKILMKIVWEVKNIVKILTEKVTSGNTKGVNLESPSFSR